MKKTNKLLINNQKNKSRGTIKKCKKMRGGETPITSKNSFNSPELQLFKKNKELQENSIKQLKQELEDNLQILEFEDKNLGIEGLKLIIDALKKEGTSITSINLKNNNIDLKNVKVKVDLINVLKSNKTLKILNLSNNNIDLLSIMTLQKVLEEKINLIIIIDNNKPPVPENILSYFTKRKTELTNQVEQKINTTPLHHVHSPKQTCSGINIKDISTNSVINFEGDSSGNECIMFLIQALKDNKTITEINLANIKIDTSKKMIVNAQFIELFNTLMKNDKVKKLNLSNVIIPPGAIDLLENLKKKIEIITTDGNLKTNKKNTETKTNLSSLLGKAVNTKVTKNAEKNAEKKLRTAQQKNFEHKKDILSMFNPPLDTVISSLDNNIQTETIEFISYIIGERNNTNSINNKKMVENIGNDKIKRYFTKETKYFTNLINNNYVNGLENMQKLKNSSNINAIIDLHGVVLPNIFRLPKNVNVVFITPVGYNACSSPRKIISYISEHINEFLNDPSCFNKNMSGKFFNHSVIYYGGQYCIDLSIGRKVNDTVTGIHIYDSTKQQFITLNQYEKRNETGIPITKNLSNTEFDSELSKSFLLDYFSNDKNQDKTFTLFFTSCRGVEEQEIIDMDKLRFYENNIEYLNFKIQYDYANKEKKINKHELYKKFKECVGINLDFSNNENNNIGLLQNTISNENLKFITEKSSRNSRITDNSSVTIKETKMQNVNLLSLSMENLPKSINNGKVKIVLKDLKHFIKDKSETDKFTILRKIIPVDKNMFFDNNYSKSLIIYIRLIKFILNNNIELINKYMIDFSNNAKYAIKNTQTLKFLEICRKIISQLHEEDLKK
jgi:hypothetical protein